MAAADQTACLMPSGLPREGDQSKAVIGPLRETARQRGLRMSAFRTDGNVRSWRRAEHLPRGGEPSLAGPRQKWWHEDMA